MNASKFSPSIGALFNDDTARVDDARLFAPESSTFSPDDYAVGRVISGRFRVEHVIGIGSMGVVLAARHLELDERVAIKFIRAEMQRVPGVVQRFAREAKAAVSIKSEHVAQVIDVGTAEGIGPYIVMEYLEGRDLAQVLELEGPLPARRAAHYIMQACEALAVAHSAGIIHRDIKPENLFLTRQGDLERIKLLDFGISKATLTGKIFGGELGVADQDCLLGTPLYMSPEQIRATSDVDHRADIWGLGAVLYELLTARNAFVADSVRLVWTRILEATPTPLAVHWPEAPPELQAVIDRCLEKEPARRFQSVAALAEALSPFAPTRARLYAQRASSILGARSDSAWPAPISSLPPGSSRAPAQGRGSLALGASAGAGSSSLALPDVSTPPVFRSRSLQLAEPGRGRVLTAMGVATLLGAWCVIELGSPQAEPTAAPAEPLPVASRGPAAGARPELLASRSVLIESQPSGALVSLGGQALGVTPLSTLLPVGMQELSLAKHGYVTGRAFLQLDPAPAGAKALRTRMVLHESRPAATSGAPAPARVLAPSAAAAKSARTNSSSAGATVLPPGSQGLPRPPPPHRVDPPPTQPAANPASAEPASATIAAEPRTPPAPAAAPSLVREPRVRLLEERPRARILD